LLTFTRNLLPLAACVLSALAHAQQPQMTPPPQAPQNVFVGKWAHHEPGSPNTSEMMASLSVYPNGTWEQQTQIAPRGKLVGTCVRTLGRYKQNYPNSIVLEATRNMLSPDCRSWSPAQLSAPMSGEMRGGELFMGGWVYHRSQ
jgi:hypothetical protein